MYQEIIYLYRELLSVYVRLVSILVLFVGRENIYGILFSTCVSHPLRHPFSCSLQVTRKMGNEALNSLHFGTLLPFDKTSMVGEYWSLGPLPNVSLGLSSSYGTYMPHWKHSKPMTSEMWWDLYTMRKTEN